MKKVVTNGAHTDPESTRLIDEMSADEADLLSRILIYTEYAYSNLLDLKPHEMIDVVKMSQGFDETANAINPDLEDAKVEIVQKLSEQDMAYISEIELVFRARVEAMRLLYGKMKKVDDKKFQLVDATVPEFIHLIQLLQEVVQQAFIIVNAPHENLAEVAQAFGKLPEDTQNKFGKKMRSWLYTEEDYASWRDEEDKSVRVDKMKAVAQDYMERTYAMLEILNEPFAGDPNEA